MVYIAQPPSLSGEAGKNQNVYLDDREFAPAKLMNAQNGRSTSCKAQGSVTSKVLVSPPSSLMFRNTMRPGPAKLGRRPAANLASPRFSPESGLEKKTDFR